MDEDDLMMCEVRRWSMLVVWAMRMRMSTALA